MYVPQPWGEKKKVQVQGGTVRDTKRFLFVVFVHLIANHMQLSFFCLLIQVSAVQNLI